MPPGGGARPPPDAYETAIRLLARRDHGEVELRRKLARRGCPEADIDAAVSRLGAGGRLDDRAFAAGLARRTARERGPALVAAELASRGIGRKDVADVLAGLDPAAEAEAALRLAIRFRGLESSRVAARLVRRGFGPAAIRAAMAGARAAI